ncbi:MAG TPA: putative sulfate/molybdate transporter [Thermodesulfobacteriota bacterium]
MSDDIASAPAAGAPAAVRPRLLANPAELSGALGDLGTFLPHVLGVVTVVGMAPAGVLAGFGLFAIVTGLRYGIPIPVQPMKAASAAVLIQHLSPAEVAGAGLAIGLFFVVAGSSGLVDWLARRIPAVLTAGVQLGLGLALALLGLDLARQEPILGALVALSMLATLRSRRLPAAVVGLVVGLVGEAVLGSGIAWPEVSWGVHVPPVVWPGWADLLRGVELAALPQIPLTLTNAIIVTAALARRLFPDEPPRATVRNLALSTGIANLLAAPFGGYPMCHGAGGLAAHYRFGSRSGTALVLIGLVFLVLGIGLGDGAVAVMRLVPESVVGALLFFGGAELARSARPERFRGAEAVVLALVAGLGLAVNAALAFVVGLTLVTVWRRGRWTPGD